MWCIERHGWCIIAAFIGARGNSLVLEGKDVPEGARRCMYVMLGGKDVIDDATRGKKGMITAEGA